jgi:DNA-binding MarR family transcriptional regulator
VTGPLPLTTRQEELWRFIASCERSPTYFEIRDALGYRAIAGIQRSLAKLEEYGFIRRVKNAKRSIELLRFPDGRKLKTFRGLADFTDEQLKAELSRREHSRISTGGRTNWMTDARLGSTRLLKALEISGVRP